MKKRTVTIGITVLAAAILFGVWQFGLNRTLPAEKDMEESADITEYPPVQEADITEAPKPTIPPIVGEATLKNYNKEEHVSIAAGDSDVKKADSDIVIENQDLETEADVTEVAPEGDAKAVKDEQEPTGTPELQDNTDLTNQETKPVYKEEAVTTKPSKKVENKTEGKSGNSDNTPKNGEIKDGKKYVLGFGWVEYSGDANGNGEGEVIGSDGDINKQVGIMD